jgi:hypothetical protein
MKLFEEINLEKLINHSTLFYGDINTGKTQKTAKFLDFLLSKKKVSPQKITILDFAPPMEFIEGMKIGGKIFNYNKDSIKCITPPQEKEIIPPRLNATNRKELCLNSLHNYRITQKFLEFYNQNPTEFLLINDISIYLHLGNKNFFLNTIKKAQTFVGNTYYGRSIAKGKEKFSLFNLKEKKVTERIIKSMDYTFYLKND